MSATYKEVHLNKYTDTSESLELTQEEFDALDENYPRQSRPGYRWKMRDGTGWLVGEYVPLSEGGILWRRLVIK